MSYNFMIVLFSRRCILPGEQANASYALPTDIMNMSYPFDYNTGNWSSCKLYDTNFTSSYNHSSTRLANSIELKSNEPSRFCNQWVYDKSTIENSAVMEVIILLSYEYSSFQMLYTSQI